MEQITLLIAQHPQPAWLVTVAIFLMLLKQALGLFRDHVSTFNTIRNAIHSEPKNIEEMAAAESVASKEMRSIALDFGADRVGISLFHNGVHSLQNVHFLRISTIAEGLSGRVGPILPVSQNRLVAEYGDLGDRIIINKERVILGDVNDMPIELLGFSDFLKIHFVKSVHLLPLFVERDGKRIVDGCLYVHHCTESVNLTTEQMDEIQARAQTVYNGLSNANKGV